MEVSQFIKLMVKFVNKNIKSKRQNLAKIITKKYDGKELVLLCVLKGSVMFMVDLAKHLKMPVKMEFIRLSSYGSGFTSTGRVSAVDIALPDLNQKNVFIIEDIIDTGHTAKFLVDFINLNFHTIN